MFHVIGAVADTLGPFGTILGVLLSVIGLGAYIRKWLKSIAADAAESAHQSTNAARSAQSANNQAETAAQQATAAGVAANTAGRHAANATQTSLDTNKAIEWLVTELVAKDEALAESLKAREYLKETVDTAVAAVAYRAAERHGTPELDTEMVETEAIMTTGRHRFPRKDTA